MKGDSWKVQVAGRNDGAVERLGLGHAWAWTRSSGAREVFDCGLSISLVLEAMAVRLGVSPRDIDMRHA